MTDGWEGTFHGNGEELESPMLANLFLDNDTRLWRLELQGPACMLLFFLLDSGENGKDFAPPFLGTRVHRFT